MKRFTTILVITIVGSILLFPTLSLPQSDDQSQLNARINQLRKAGRYNPAIALAQTSLSQAEKTFGPDHPGTARALTVLGNLYRVTGRYADAEPLLRRALTIIERSPGGLSHPSLASPLTFLAMVYNVTGRYAEAEPLIKRAIDIRERAKNRQPEAIAFDLTILAEVYFNTGRRAEADEMIKRALAIWEKHDRYSPDGIAYSLTSIARMYRVTGRYAEAQPLIERSLAICESALGPDNPNVAFALNNLAMIYRHTGRTAEVEQLYLRALAIWQKSLGRNHPIVSTALANLGFYYGATGKHKRADNVFKRSCLIQDSARESIFTVLTEKQKLSYMKRQEWGMFAYMSHTLSFPQSSETAVEDVFNAWLKWKGSVIEAQGRYLNAIAATDNPKVQAKLAELTTVKKDIARLELSGPGRSEPEEYARKMSELEKLRDRLEIEIMADSKDYVLRKKAQAVDAKVLSSLLPADAVYLDFAKINFFDFKARKWKEPRYVLFIFNPSDNPAVRLTGIGPSADLDRHINAYLKEMGRAKTEGVLPDEKKLTAEASALYSILVKPVEPFLKGKKRLIISPDGNLNLMPFETMVDPGGTYLMEGYLVSYVGAGRDMVSFSQPSLKGGLSLVIADPDYDLGQKDLQKARASSDATGGRTRGFVSRDASGMRFDRLPDTRKEADAIEKILRDTFGQKVENRQDKAALEYILFATSSPKVLHLATHGYFLTEEETRHRDGTDELSLTDDLLQDTTDTIENPMIRSGIVLAGANTSLSEGRDDGMVTAEKVLGLRLKGTDLVVLSACQTGVGDIQSGEGVFGLKRAFILSGAKTIVMSLWSVPSQETVDLMTSFYTYIASGKPNAEALRLAKLSVMKQKPHPFFWGAFVMTGSP